MLDLLSGWQVDVTIRWRQLADAGEFGGGWQIARTGRVALQRELRQEIIRARTDSERSIELDDAAKLAAPKAAGASAGAIGASLFLSLSLSSPSSYDTHVCGFPPIFFVGMPTPPACCATCCRELRFG